MNPLEGNQPHPLPSARVTGEAQETDQTRALNQATPLLSAGFLP